MSISVIVTEYIPFRKAKSDEDKSALEFVFLIISNLKHYPTPIEVSKICCRNTS